MMIKALKMILASVRRLQHEWRMMSVLAITYALLLAALYLFVATKEASALQVLLTLIWAALAPALFFMLQAMIVNYAQGEAQVLALLRRSFRDSCKLALVSLPLILASIIFLYLLNKLQPYFPAEIKPPVMTSTTTEIWPVPTSQSSMSAKRPLDWSLLMMPTLRFLLFGVVLPLMAVCLWSATVRDGVLLTFKKIRHHLARIFAPESVLIYTIGLVLFAITPYLLLFTRTPVSKAGLEFGLFIARVALAFIFTLTGWVLTLDALTGKREIQTGEGLSRNTSADAEVV